ncbi:hypothetical protein Hanom_Chr12g01178471 [Helianthus anomalus]
MKGPGCFWFRANSVPNTTINQWRTYHVKKIDVFSILLPLKKNFCYPSSILLQAHIYQITPNI